MLKEINDGMNKLYRKSPLNNSFEVCVVIGLRKGSVLVDSHCYFKNTPEVNIKSVEQTFIKGTQEAKWLENKFQLQEFTISPLQPQELPFWAIILICLAALLTLVLLFLLCFLLAFCRRRRKGSYQIQQAAHGVYFPHLDMRKTY
uniref:Mucin-16-like n=1 Tax=Geotrypetes seraphini TaxID=260995 RepID=A0A6P8S0R5_GEOSA|nr:mucin-16-like [Geotrypetes seraphini]